MGVPSPVTMNDGKIQKNSRSPSKGFLAASPAILFQDSFILNEISELQSAGRSSLAACSGTYRASGLVQKVEQIVSRREVQFQDRCSALIPLLSADRLLRPHLQAAARRDKSPCGAVATKPFGAI
jgi:hypothetical protein